MGFRLASRYLRLGPKVEDSLPVIDRAREIWDLLRAHLETALGSTWQAVLQRSVSVRAGGGTEQAAVGQKGERNTGVPRGINRWFQDPPEFPVPALPGVQGLGVYIYPGGAQYEGELYHGKCNGSGVYYFRVSEANRQGGFGFGFGVGSGVSMECTVSADGGTYFGTERVLGYPVDYGKQSSGTQDVLGELGGTAAGVDYGTDVRTLTENGYGRYEGDWVDGRYDGYGVEAYANGSRYRGQYRHGLREGYGVYFFRSGERYSGEWRGGQSEGVGVQTCRDGSRYVGEFRQGEKHGKGTYKYRCVGRM